MNVVGEQWTFYSGWYTVSSFTMLPRFFYQKWENLEIMSQAYGLVPSVMAVELA